MRKTITISLLIILGLTLAIWGFSYFIQPVLSKEVNNILYLFGLALIATITLLTGIPDLVERLSGKKKAELDEQQRQRNRRNMLLLVWNTWIEGYLKKSLYNEVLIELGMKTKPDAVEHPWDMQIQMLGQEPELIPPGTEMIEVFDQANKSLLILGEPGSGKTTMLLELTRQVIERAKEDELQPIPVMFNLSSWTPKLTIADWLAEELQSSMYNIIPKISYQWIENDDLLLLLDGLDEVAEINREKCVQAINDFRAKHQVELVVCSRRQEYQTLAARLMLKVAVVIQPMDDEQVIEYLKFVGNKFVGPYKSLVNYTKRISCMEEERNFLHTPFFLSILTLAYQDVSVRELEDLVVSGDYRKRLFDDYIERMFTHRKTEQFYNPKQTKIWLAWLASSMIRNGHTVFFIEDIQPSQIIFSKTKLRLFLGLIFGLLSGLLNGGGFGLLSGLLLGPLFGLFFGLFVGFIFGVIHGLFIVLSVKDSYFEPTERIRWSWRNVIILGLFSSLGSGLFCGLSYGLSVSLIVGLLVGLSPMSYFAMSSPDPKNRYMPEEGIKASWKNLLIIEMSFLILIGLGVGLFAGYIRGLLFGLLSGLLVIYIFGPTFGPILGLNYGEKFLLAHYFSRWQLYRTGYLPWNLVTFLDYATYRIFLRRVGGGYIFIHRMLMEHFANMYEESKKAVII